MCPQRSESSPAVELSALQARFTETVKKIKIPRLRSRTTLRTTSPIGSSQDSPADCNSSDSTTHSSSSLFERFSSPSSSSSATTPSSSSRLSLFSPSNSTKGSPTKSSPDGQRRVRTMSEHFTPRHHSTMSSTASPIVPTCPRAPRIVSIQDGQWVHQNLLLVFGEAGSTENCGSNGHIIVHHHMDIFSATKWTVCNGYFKALVRLEPGPNKLRFEYINSRSSSFSTEFLINMLPLSANTPLQLAVLIGSDSSGERNRRFGGENSQKDDENWSDVIVKKLRMAGYLLQAFTGDHMYRYRLGRRCFRLEEEWTGDTLSAQEGTSMKNIAKVHIIQTQNTVDEIRQLEAAENGNAIRALVYDAVDSYFGRQNASRRHVAVVVLDAKGNLRLPGITGTSAMSHGIGIVGSKGIHTLPSTLEGVTSTFSDCSRISTDLGFIDSAESGFVWESASLTLGNMLEAFLSPQPEIVSRNFFHLNRSFCTKEPYSLRTKTQGLSPVLPHEEDVWPKIDCLRMRYHPCFKLPTDFKTSEVPENPQVYVIDSGIITAAASGIILILIFIDGKYRDYLEYPTRPPKEVILTDKDLLSRTPDITKSSRIDLKIFSAARGEIMLEDFATALKRARLQVPNGVGALFKSVSLKNGEEKVSGKKQELVLDSLTAGRLLTGIKVYHATKFDGIEFLYDDQSSQLFGNKCSESDASEFAIDARKGESLLGFCVRSNSDISGLEILTSFGRRSTYYGSLENGVMKTNLIPPTGYSIAGISGCYNKYINDISILYR